MSRVSRAVVDLLVFLAVLSMGFAMGFFYANENADKGEVVIDEKKDGFDLELPGEVERRVVTIEEVNGKLQEMAELTTYSDSYEVTLGKEETRYFLEKIEVPGTTNSITIKASGIVKVGYNMSDFVVKIDDTKIYIAVPEPMLNDNYVIWDTIQCSEKNNFLNPIEFSQYEELITEIEKMGLADAEAAQIYEKADENVKKIINAFLSEFVDYEVVFM